MVFSSLLFLFRFLPLTLLAYYSVPGKLRNLVLFIASLIFYAWGEPVYIVLILFSTLVDYTTGRLAGFFRNRDKGSGHALPYLYQQLQIWRCSLFLSTRIFFCKQSSPYLGQRCRFSIWRCR